jgi:hypothetical protein
MKDAFVPAGHCPPPRAQPLAVPPTDPPYPSQEEADRVPASIIHALAEDRGA